MIKWRVLSGFPIGISKFLFCLEIPKVSLDLVLGMAWAWAVGSPARGKVCPNYNLWLVSDIGGGCGQGDTGTSAAMETPSDQHQCFSWSSNIVKSPSCSKWAGDELEVVGTEREKSIPGQQPNKIPQKIHIPSSTLNGLATYISINSLWSDRNCLWCGSYHLNVILKKCISKTP